MELKIKAMAGTMESSDCLITVAPSTVGQIEIEIESIVQKQFGKQIEKVIRKTLNEMNVSSAKVRINDKGALDCVIIARLKTTIMRSKAQTEFNWEVNK